MGQHKWTYVVVGMGFLTMTSLAVCEKDRAREKERIKRKGMCVGTCGHVAMFWPGAYSRNPANSAILSHFPRVLRGP
jgi:hypothetical protein